MGPDLSNAAVSPGRKANGDCALPRLPRMSPSIDGGRHGRAHDSALGESVGLVEFVGPDTSDLAGQATRAWAAQLSSEVASPRLRCGWRSARDTLARPRGSDYRRGKVIENTGRGVGRGPKVVEFGCGLPKLQEASLGEELSCGIGGHCRVHRTRDRNGARRRGVVRSGEQ